MAKARAARERELALERASQALKNGGLVSYQDYSQLLDQKVDTPPTDQPSPESLDKMLRPSVPRLGEIPIAQAPTWSESPTVQNMPLPTSSDLSSLNRSTIGGGFDSVPANYRDLHVQTAGQEFSDLSEQGLDFLLRDVMDGMTFDGTTATDTGVLHAIPNFGISQSQVHAQPHFQPFQAGGILDGSLNGNLNRNGSTSMNSLSNFTSSSLFPAPDLADSPNTLGESSGQSSHSPAMDTTELNATIPDPTNMDWASWDDLVSQYGMEGQTGPNANAAGHLGMVHWF